MMTMAVVVEDLVLYIICGTACWRKFLVSAGNLIPIPWFSNRTIVTILTEVSKVPQLTVLRKSIFMHPNLYVMDMKSSKSVVNTRDENEMLLAKRRKQYVYFVTNIFW
jgi:hypothetical protein